MIKEKPEMCKNKDFRQPLAYGNKHKLDPGHIHNTGEAKMENIIEPDCETPGSYDEVFYCIDCYSELSRESKTIPALGHDYVDGYCKRCGVLGYVPINYVIKGETITKNVKIGESATDITLSELNTQATVYYNFTGWTDDKTTAKSVERNATENDLDNGLTLYAIQTHTHNGTAGLTYASGCCNEAYSSYEKTGTRQQVNEWYDNNCCSNCRQGPNAHFAGNPYGACGSFNSHWTSTTTVDTYGYVTRYRCTKANKIG